MAEHTSLTSLFSDIADAIRTKAGTSSQIVADDFPTAIANIPSGGGTDVSDTTAVATDVASGKIFHTADGTRTVGTLDVPKVATGSLVISATEHYENIGFKPKYLVVNENNASAPTLRLVSVYSEDSSTSQIAFSNLATGASGFSALPNAATHRINSIDDNGFTIKPASAATSYWNYFAIG